MTAHETFHGSKGQWRIWQDSPEFDCNDNPSYLWFATEYVNGHSVRTIASTATRQGVLDAIAQLDATHARGKAEEAASALASPGKQPVEMIDMTPSWSGILPALLVVLEGGTNEANKRSIREELQRMADAADKWNAHRKAAKG